jgi:hypothetical protein
MSGAHKVAASGAKPASTPRCSLQPSHCPSSIDDPTYPEDAAFWPDVDDLVTEDDTPVDNIFSEKQQRLLTEPLYSARSESVFRRMANVGLFYRTHHPPLVPDMLLSLGVRSRRTSGASRIAPISFGSSASRRTWWSRWSPTAKATRWTASSPTTRPSASSIYAVFDPEQLLGERLLRLHELHGATYVERAGLWMPDIDLGLCLWEGSYEGMPARWLRWCDAAGEPIATGAERQGRRAIDARRGQQPAIQPVEVAAGQDLRLQFGRDVETAASQQLYDGMRPALGFALRPALRLALLASPSFGDPRSSTSSRSA